MISEVYVLRLDILNKYLFLIFLEGRFCFGVEECLRNFEVYFGYRLGIIINLLICFFMWCDIKLWKVLFFL